MARTMFCLSLLRQCELMMQNANLFDVAILGRIDVLGFHSFLNLLHSAAPSKPIFSELLQLFYQGEHDSRTLDFIQAK